MAYIRIAWNDKNVTYIGLCPIVFILFCDLGQHGWVLEHKGDG